VEGSDLRALKFLEFVVTNRPAVGVLRDLRAATLLPLPAVPEPTLAAATANDLALIRDATPIFRIAAPQPSPSAPERLDHVFADFAGHWLAAAFEVNSEVAPQRLVIWKTGSPAAAAKLPTEEELASAMRPQELMLRSLPSP